jgi:hypothetical protein
MHLEVAIGSSVLAGAHPSRSDRLPVGLGSQGRIFLRRMLDRDPSRPSTLRSTADYIRSRPLLIYQFIFASGRFEVSGYFQTN